MPNGSLKDLLKKIKLNESTISMFLGALVVLVIGVLVFNYFRSVNQPAQEEVQSETIPAEADQVISLEDLPTVYTVKKGDNLWKIAENIYGSGYNWVDIAQENNLTNPDLLAVGQELNIPKAEIIQPEITVFGTTITGDSYTVAEGDHLWGIAVRAYGDGYQWVKIAQENNLDNPNLIHPGNVLKLSR